MRPTIVTWAPPNELRWRASFLSRRLFSGEHGFRLESTAVDRSRFVQDETFSGLLVPLYARLRLAHTRLGFDQMNAALRERAEKRAVPQPSQPPTTGPTDDRSSPGDGSDRPIDGLSAGT